MVSAGATARLTLGWAFGALGVLNLAMGSAGSHYLLFHAVLLVTAVALMSYGRLRRARSGAMWLVAGAVTLLGLVLTTVPALDAGCCLRDQQGRHGFPFTMFATGGGWRVDGVLLVADFLFWASAGFLVLTVITLARRVPPKSAPTATNPTHAEGRAAEVQAPRDESVGGLP
jgi:hypothetical protein